MSVRALIGLFFVSAALVVVTPSAPHVLPGNAGGRQLRTVKVGLFPAATTYAGIYLAQQRGLYAKEGLKVQLVPMFGGRIPAAAAGQVDVAFDFIPDVLLAQEAGTPVLIVASKEAVNSIATLSLKSSGIRTPRDYAHRSFASNPGSLEFSLLPVLGRRNGFDASTIDIVQLDFSALLPTLLSGRVDIITAFYASNAYPFSSLALAAGKPVTMIRWSKYGLDTYGDSVIVRRSLARSNPALVRKFLRATFRGFAYGAAHPDKVFPVVSAADPTAEGQTTAVNWKRTLELLNDRYTRKHGLGWIEPKKLKQTRQIVFGALGKRAKLRLRDVYTDALLPRPKVTLPRARRG